MREVFSQDWEGHILNPGTLICDGEAETGMSGWAIFGIVSSVILSLGSCCACCKNNCW